MTSSCLRLRVPWTLDFPFCYICHVYIWLQELVAGYPELHTQCKLQNFIPLGERIWVFFFLF